jgi:hypothetical protein
MDLLAQINVSQIPWYAWIAIVVGFAFLFIDKDDIEWWWTRWHGEENPDSEVGPEVVNSARRSRPETRAEKVEAVYELVDDLDAMGHPDQAEYLINEVIPRISRPTLRRPRRSADIAFEDDNQRQPGPQTRGRQI